MSAAGDTPPAGTGPAPAPGPAADSTLDATGLKCPLPVLKAARRLQQMAPGQILRVLSDDPAGVVDFPHFCAEQGHVLEAARTDTLPHVHLIRRGPGRRGG